MNDTEIREKLRFFRSRTECGDLVKLSLNDETITQLKKHLGIYSEPSPTSVAKGPPAIQPTERDGYKDLINSIVTYFITEVMKFMLIHVQFVCSMEIRNVDVKFAIEQFAKQEEREMQLEDNTEGNESDDVEWQPGKEDEECIDDHMYDSDDSDDSDDSEGNRRRRPTKYRSPTFKSMFPRLTESENFFKLSACDARCLAGEVMQTLHRCDLPFCQNTDEIIKDALLRYLVVACRL